MSFQEKLKVASAPKADAVERLNSYLEALPKDEQLALRELLIGYPVRVSFDALKEEGYRINRETVSKWRDRYVVQG